MAQTTEAPVAPPPRADERLGRKSPLARVLARPEAGGERQCVAISRAVHFGAKVLILDEPTAAEARGCTGRVGALLRRLGHAAGLAASSAGRTARATCI
jgi:ABC-type sugar transport system ATPase subunit